MPRVMTPTMSRCATRMAVNAPFNANANVPARSKTSSTDASDIARVYRISTADPSQSSWCRLIDKRGGYEPYIDPAYRRG